MESVLDFLDNYIDIIVFAVFGLLAAAAVIRSMIKVKKGKKSVLRRLEFSMICRKASQALRKIKSGKERRKFSHWMTE